MGHSATQVPSVPTDTHDDHKQETNKPQMPADFREFTSQTRLTEQEMSLVAAQAVSFARARAPVAVFVTGMTFPILVGVLARRALVG